MDNENVEKKIQAEICPECGNVCSFINKACMFSGFADDDLFYCDKCRITYSCDSKGKKIIVSG